MSAEFDYRALGLVAGLEIHQQLDTTEKLFCACPTQTRDPEDSVRRFTRYLHPTRSELGEIDEAALEEASVDRTFEYLAYDTTCLVEEDDEPPHRLDEEALEVALEIAQLLDMEVVDSAQVMRKVVIDGSNTSGFQRTLLLARDGMMETGEGVVGVEDLLLEEESARRIEATEGGVRFGLDRLGIPLVEIGTRPDIRTPEQAQDAAERIGMILRSTGKVKRGLGTIRQDVNVSIAEGARVEIKGVQALDDIADIVREEVRRQVRLLEIAEELDERDAAIGSPMDVTDAVAETDSSILGDSLADGGEAWALRLTGFDGLVGAELQPDRRLGSELADHARRHGVGGLFHSDELPGYGITDSDVTAVREAVGAGPNDAFALVAGEPSSATAAIDAVAERAVGAIDGVPEETRDATPEGTTTYLRPLPGAARMYPETDVPPVEPDVTGVEVPPLLTERVERYVEEYGLDRSLAEQVAYSRRMPLFERAIEIGVAPTLAADTVERTITELRREDVPVTRLTVDHFEGTFELLAGEEIPREGLPKLLRTLAENPSLDAATAAEDAGLERAGEGDVREVVERVVERNAEQIQSEGMAAFSALMGECMGELRGKADGDLVSEVLREEIQRRG